MRTVGYSRKHAIKLMGAKTVGEAIRRCAKDAPLVWRTGHRGVLENQQGGGVGLRQAARGDEGVVVATLRGALQQIGKGAEKKESSIEDLLRAWGLMRVPFAPDEKDTFPARSHQEILPLLDASTALRQVPATSAKITSR